MRRFFFRGAAGVIAAGLLAAPVWTQFLPQAPPSAKKPLLPTNPISRSDRMALVASGAVKVIVADETKKGVIEEIFTQTQALSAPVPGAVRQKLDPGKRVLELPVKNLAKAAQPAAVPLIPPPALRDPTKSKRIEPPAKGVVGKTAPVVPAVASKNEDNPIVKPGEVKWHASFAEAKDAATKSGKPVLLFHMMGQLDRQFC